MLRIASVFLLLIFERLIALSGRIGLWEWTVVQTVLFSVLPILFIKASGVKGEEVGLSKGDLRTGLWYVVVMLLLAMPFMFYGAMLPSFKEYYPIWGPARSSILSFVVLELAVLVMMFNTEFFFRGLLLFSLERKMLELNSNKWAANLIHSFIYMVVHFGKPGLEVPYSFFVGLIFGWLALKTRSILPTFIAHWTSSVIFDVLVLVL